METPTLQTQVHGQPFLITGNEEAIIDLAEQLRHQQRVEYASYMAKAVLTAPVRATAVLAKGIGRAVAHNVREAYEDWELREHDSRYGTSLYDQKQQAIIQARTHRLVQKVGL